METGKFKMIACAFFIGMLLNACSKSNNGLSESGLSDEAAANIATASSNTIVPTTGSGFNNCFDEYFKYVKLPPEVSTLHGYFDCLANDRQKVVGLGHPNLRQPQSTPVPPSPEIRSIDEVFSLAGMSPADMYNDEKVHELKVILSPYVKLLNEALNKLGKPDSPAYKPSPGSPYMVNIEAIRSIVDKNIMLDGYDRSFLLNFMYIVYNNRLGKPMGMMEKLGLDLLLYKPVTVPEP